jgi:hypothetical protein
MNVCKTDLLWKALFTEGKPAFEEIKIQWAKMQSEIAAISATIKVRKSILVDKKWY